ncbi:MAG: hypothetical protein ACO1N9_01300 [Flavobacterium sp.]
MVDYQFTIKPEHEQFIYRIEAFIKTGAVAGSYEIIKTKDGTILMMEFEEQYQANKFDYDLKSNYPYLFVE